MSPAWISAAIASNWRVYSASPISGRGVPAQAPAESGRRDGTASAGICSQVSNSPNQSSGGWASGGSGQAAGSSAALAS